MDEFDEDEVIIDVTSCSKCADITEHEVLKRSKKGTGEDLLVRSIECGDVHNLELRPPKMVQIKTTLSDRRDSRFEMIESDDDEKLTVGDIFEVSTESYKITRIEDSTSRQRRRLRAKYIGAMWAVRVDQAVVPITMTEGEKSWATSIECDPEKVFSCGTIMQMDGRRWRIRALHTGKGRTLTGKRVASEIRRLYLHPPDEKEDRFSRYRY